MSWKQISEIKVVCKQCNQEMVFESSLNDTNIILGCNKCKGHVNLSCSGSHGDGVNVGGGMQPPTKKVGNGHFGIFGGIVKKTSSNMYLFKVMCDDLDYLRKVKEMNNWFMVDDGFMTTVQLGYYDKKKDEEE